MPDDLTLFHYSRNLQELIAFREERLADPTDPPDEEELAVLGSQIQSCVAGELTKVDSVAAWILWRESQIAAARIEIDRLKRFVNSACSDVTQIKGYCKDILLALPEPKKGSQRLQGSTHSLSLRTNGGLVALEIEDESMVPSEYRDATVTMPYEDWGKIEGFLPNAAKVAVSLNNAKIRADLEQDIGVPGCRLAERGKTVKIL